MLVKWRKHINLSNHSFGAINHAFRESGTKMDGWRGIMFYICCISQSLMRMKQKTRGLKQEEERERGGCPSPIAGGSPCPMSNAATTPSDPPPPIYQ